MKSASLIVPLLLIAGLQPSQAGTALVSKYNITPEERAACQADAISYCSHVYPDEDRLIDCMKSNRDSLSPTCLKTFTAGLARRHINPN